MTIDPVSPKLPNTLQCRRQGETVRKMIDCLVAAVAIRVDAPVLHMDRDYDILARHTPMQAYQLT